MKGAGVHIRLVILATAIATVCGGSVLARLVHLQVDEHNRYRQQANEASRRTLPVPAMRGEILDRDGNPLALSVASRDIVADPGDVTDAAAVARLLAPILGDPARELQRRLSQDKSYVRLATQAHPDQIGAVRQLIGAGSLPGIRLDAAHRRVYPNGPLAGHVLGFVQVDGPGVAGIEYRWNDTLRGENGRYFMRRDGKGKVFEQAVIREPRPGRDLTLTLDLDVQHVLEEELAHAATRARARAGAAIAMNPRTGEILASASWPEFNPNPGNRRYESQIADHAVVQLYEPGSTFKIITAAAALEKGEVSPGEVIHCGNGKILVKGRYRINDHKSFGDLTFTDIMAQSSNVGAIKVGQRLQANAFHDTILRFGFARRTGSGLAGEQPGKLASPDEWSVRTQPSLSMGQEILVTPLQILAATAAVANDGMAVKPWIVRSVRDRLTGEVESFAPPEPRRVISGRTARTLTRMLEEVVEDGTATAAAVPGYRVAGKTGTAQMVRPGTRGYDPDLHIASFVGFAPARNPELVAIFVIKEPGVKAYHGGDVAAPAFGRFAARVLPGLGVAPDPYSHAGDPVRITLSPPAAAATTLRASLLHVAPATSLTRERAAGVMPDLTGHSLRQAVAMVTDLGITPHLVGQGHVLSQEPPAGSPLPAGKEGCRLWLGRR